MIHFKNNDSFAPFLTGMQIAVDWPKGGDPNWSYRPWLEKNVGSQALDWQWFLSTSVDDKGYIDTYRLIIKFCKGKEELAVQASLMWNN